MTNVEGVSGETIQYARITEPVECRSWRMLLWAMAAMLFVRLLPSAIGIIGAIWRTGGNISSVVDLRAIRFRDVPALVVFALSIACLVVVVVPLVTRKTALATVIAVLLLLLLDSGSSFYSQLGIFWGGWGVDVLGALHGLASLCLRVSVLAIVPALLVSTWSLRTRSREMNRRAVVVSRAMLGLVGVILMGLGLIVIVSVPAIASEPAEFAFICVYVAIAVAGGLGLLLCGMAKPKLLRVSIWVIVAINLLLVFQSMRGIWQFLARPGADVMFLVSVMLSLVSALAGPLIVVLVLDRIIARAHAPLAPDERFIAG